MITCHFEASRVSARHIFSIQTINAVIPDATTDNNELYSTSSQCNKIYITLNSRDIHTFNHNSPLSMNKLIAWMSALGSWPETRFNSWWWRRIIVDRWYLSSWWKLNLSDSLNDFHFARSRAIELFRVSDRR